jgi:AraC family transcriptional regulator of adaptative response/methylated-DNA-[protein]-cysteine methyltransferase
MQASNLPSQKRMITAFLDRDATYEGIFVTAVKTTGIFCRPTCSARKPKVENVEFFASSKQALVAGYRACKRCQPMKALGSTPDWLAPLLAEVEKDRNRRWRDQDLRERGLQPERVRRWFKNQHDMTFHAYTRARRLAAALGRIQHGDSIIDSAFESGYASLSGFNEAFTSSMGIRPSQSKSATTLSVSRLTTPLGPIIAAATSKALYLLEFAERRMLATQFKTLAQRLDCVFVGDKNEIIRQAEWEIDEYFAGRLEKFKVPLATPGTEFQQSVWQSLKNINYGQTRSYQQVAAEVSNPKAVRAVARANGANRIAIIIPCHRVIGADGSLTGYGGGLWRKQRLLDLESGIAQPELFDRSDIQNDLV